VTKLTAQTDGAVSPLLREAAEWRLIALLFECPGPAWRAQLQAIASEINDALLNTAVEAACREACPELYHTTFGPGGPAAPREVSYRSGELPGNALAELRSLYQAFAYEPALPEPPDHVAVEIGFVAYLRLKRAYAVARGASGQAEMCASAERHFIADHLRVIAEPLAKSLAVSGISYLAHAAETLRLRVAGILTGSNGQNPGAEP
jgi:nitrate reductase assembly molybdenum cofactor insertion protein NarJ